jgi:myosin heavy subunit
LQAKIQDLENSNRALITQLEGANQETSRGKEQLNELHEMSQRKEQQARELEQKFNEAQMNIKNFNAEKNKYITVQDSEKKCQDIAKAADAQKVTMKTKLESEIKNLEQRNKEVEAELVFANQEVRRYRDGNDAYSDKATQIQAELTLYKERFAQQFSQLQQLDTRITEGETSRTNPRPQGEIAELRKYFLSVRSETSQSIEAVARTLRNVEERFRNLDSLEKEKDKLEEQNGSMQKRLEALTDRMRHNPQDNGHVDVFLPSKGGLVMATPQQTFATGSDARKLRSSVRPSSVNSNYSISTPEETLRSNSNRMGPKSLAFQLENELHATPSLIMKMPAVQKTGETPTNNHLLDTSYFNFAPSVLQHQGTNQRTLRAASRKRSNLAKASPAEGVESLSSPLAAPPSAAAPSYGLRYSTVVVSCDTQTPSYIRPFSEMTPTDDVSSDLTDMDPVIEQLDLVNTQQQLRDRIEQGRINKYKRTDTSAHESNTALQAVTTHTEALLGKVAPVHQADDDGNPPAKVIKFTKSAPSNSEESYRRRNSQPGKSALKKTGISTRTTEDATRKTATFDAAQGAPILQDRTSARANKKQSHAKNISIGSFKGAVSGRGVTAMAEKLSIASQSGMDGSPPMKEPSRNKRYDSSTLESSKRKIPRTSLAREQSRREIPDSQEDYFPEQMVY